MSREGVINLFHLGIGYINEETIRQLEILGWSRDTDSIHLLNGVRQIELWEIQSFLAFMEYMNEQESA